MPRYGTVVWSSTKDTDEHVNWSTVSSHFVIVFRSSGMPIYSTSTCMSVTFPYIYYGFMKPLAILSYIAIVVYCRA